MVRDASFPSSPTWTSIPPPTASHLPVARLQMAEIARALSDSKILVADEPAAPDLTTETESRSSWCDFVRPTTGLIFHHALHA